jgi:hypothetical protein
MTTQYTMTIRHAKELVEECEWKKSEDKKDVLDALKDFETVAWYKEVAEERIANSYMALQFMKMLPDKLYGAYK